MLRSICPCNRAQCEDVSLAGWRWVLGGCLGDLLSYGCSRVILMQSCEMLCWSGTELLRWIAGKCKLSFFGLGRWPQLWQRVDWEIRELGLSRGFIKINIDDTQSPEIPRCNTKCLRTIIKSIYFP